MIKRFSLQFKLQAILTLVGLVGLSFMICLSYQGISAVTSTKQDQVAAAAAAIADKVDRNLFERYGDVQAFAVG